jgi:hypothetical protein
MVQAARSGKQNILEGSQASGTSKETEIKLTNVARASLQELLEDYRDFLRVRRIAEWPKEHSHTRRLRELNRQPNPDYNTFQKGFGHFPRADTFIPLASPLTAAGASGAVAISSITAIKSGPCDKPANPRAPEDSASKSFTCQRRGSFGAAAKNS